MLERLVRPGDEAVERGRDVDAHLAHRGLLAESTENSPLSRIAVAASTSACAATHARLPPMLTRFAPASAISASVSPRRASTFTGFETASHTARISPAVRNPGA